MERVPAQPSRNEQPPTLEQETLSPEQTADLADAAKQEEYRQAFLLQQMRRSCPGCGDEGSSFA